MLSQVVRAQACSGFSFYGKEQALRTPCIYDQRLWMEKKSYRRACSAVFWLLWGVCSLGGHRASAPPPAAPGSPAPPGVWGMSHPTAAPRGPGGSAATPGTELLGLSHLHSRHIKDGSQAVQQASSAFKNHHKKRRVPSGMVFLIL